MSKLLDIRRRRPLKRQHHLVAPTLFLIYLEIEFQLASLAGLRALLRQGPTGCVSCKYCGCDPSMALFPGSLQLGPKAARAADVHSACNVQG